MKRRGSSLQGQRPSAISELRTSHNSSPRIFFNDHSNNSALTLVNSKPCEIALLSCFSLLQSMRLTACFPLATILIVGNRILSSYWTVSPTRVPSSEWQWWQTYRLPSLTATEKEQINTYRQKFGLMPI